MATTDGKGKPKQKRARVTEPAPIDTTFPAFDLEKRLDFFIEGFTEYQRIRRCSESRKAVMRWVGDLYAGSEDWIEPAEDELEIKTQTLQMRLALLRTAAEENLAPAVRTLIKHLARIQRPEDECYRVEIPPMEIHAERGFAACLGEWQRLLELFDLDEGSIPSDETLQEIIRRAAATLGLLRAMFRQIRFPVQHMHENEPEFLDPKIAARYC